MKEYITMDSFGSDCPDKWEQIAYKLNYAIDELTADDMSDDDINDLVDKIWEDFCNGDLRWYAVMTDEEDNDWGNGSYILDRAKEMVRRNRDIYPDGYIAVIQEGVDPLCIDKVYDI